MTAGSIAPEARRPALDVGGYPRTLDEAATAAVDAEQAGLDGWWSVETQLDPFLSCALAAERTQRIRVGTGIAVAFARSPMSVAVMANDLAVLSAGRFVLGLGSQVRPHITKRFSMPWSAPAARMREYVLALRAIWTAFETGEPLRFEGDHYRHTLLPPFFNPGPSGHADPEVMIAAVGPMMTRVAGEVGDGVLCHAFSTERYLRDVTVPAIEEGRARSGRTLDGFQVCVGPLVGLCEEDGDPAEPRAAIRSQLAFYGSTAAYRPVLEHHGWEGLQDELAEMSRRGRWTDMASAIDDDVLDAFAIVGTPDAAAAELQRRFGDVADRLVVAFPTGTDALLRERLARAFSAAHAADAH